ncbi:MAG: hypothetical protein R3310_14925, partial [Candidatus Competibacteraceae bacterium]|nr:hypothetical protein [Candidatus Competibacteraceae bacterium]
MRPGLMVSLLLLALPALALPVIPQGYLLVVGGIGGEDYYRQLFHRRALTLLDVARQQLGVPEQNITYLAETPEDDPAIIDGPSRKERVLAALARLAQRSSPNDRILVVLIGHGTFGPGGILFNLPGPDLSAGELAVALKALAGRQLAVINTAPASAPF